MFNFKRITMKRFYFALLVSSLFIGCQSPDKYTIEGDLGKENDGKKVYLRFENQLGVLKDIDSCEIKDGKFEFVGKATYLDIFTVSADDLNMAMNIILEPGTISIKFAKKPGDKPQVGGTPYNDQLQAFNEKYLKFDEDIYNFQKKNFDLFKKAQKENDSVTMKKLFAGVTAINTKKFDFFKNYPAKNPTHFMSVILIQQRLFSGDTSFVALRDAYKKLDPKLKETRIGKQVEERLKAIENTRLNKQKGTSSPAVKAQDFSAKNPEGKTISLKESMGKVTLVDFWASWCPPCRKENPNVVKMYQALHPKGLAIIGVSLDTSAEAWKKAIAQDGLTWPQISNLKGWKDPIALQYKVEEIPTTLVLDAQGNIVARGLTGEALRAKIESLLP